MFELIEDKIQKNIDKVIHDWKEEGIVVEKARWGRSVILKGKIKIELNKDVSALENCKIKNQIFNGVGMRMAILTTLFSQA